MRRSSCLVGLGSKKPRMAGTGLRREVNGSGKLFSLYTVVSLASVWLLSVGVVDGQASSTVQTNDTASFIPATNVWINCGGTSNASVPNVGLFLTDTTGYISEGILATNSVPTNNDNNPYPDLLNTARIFAGQSAYKIPVVPGNVWIRLWFYPVTYQTYKPSNGLFSVTANEYTLLMNLTQTDGVFIYKEYMIQAKTNILTLTFIPAALDKFAYVNGLAVVSAPATLLPSNVYLVPKQAVTFSMDNNGVETMYRLNVGGGTVSPSNDSFLTRQWEGDQKYLYGAAQGVALSPVAPNLIVYPNDVPRWMAPASVYATARVLGTSGVAAALANITWIFDIDPGYAYYVRLHFAELQHNSIGQRVFNVFLNNGSAFPFFDVVAYGGGNPETAVFLDYVLTMYDFTVDKLWVQIGPAKDSSQFADCILNGLEIFKINNTNSSLAGTAIHIPLASDSGGGKSSNIGTIIGAAVGGGVALMAILGAIFFFCCAPAKGGVKKQSSPAWLPLPLHGGNSESTASKISTTASHKSGTGSYVSSAASNLGRYFTFAELQEGTNNFDEELLLGVGGFGKVYKAEIDDGVKVAVKRGNPRSEQGLTEFQTEIELLSKLRHRHLVSLIGYCEEHCEMILVYDYMANGPLRGHLYGTDLPPLTWKQRLEICIGAARGLHYLHTGAAQGIIHRDVKTTNILLDENFVAKVADFGLSKTGPSLDRTHVSTAVKGSFGYLDPEYFRRQQLTEKSDVYSFGVVLMEVVCARPAINPALPREQVNIAEWAMQWQKMGMLEQIIDPKLVGYINPESLRKFGETAEKCLAEQGIDRPAMGDVLWNLEYALQLQENSMENRLMEGSTNHSIELRPLRTPEPEEADLTTTNHSIDSEEESEDATASAVFSQLVNPQGR
ncbi:protein MpFERONIA/MpTHESEUS [Marchantia polymorpha subsp. ruderalis]|nr:theseus [Marchantia polymorpha]PTQ26606.1 hypothetical protein MARPO_0869s0001 [Marchantia polymorpha]BAF79940.1 receptor-like kinase [Marchantia polymorpha]BBN08956.1 hypothetical protein Mp_4g15890 [Marchantia polymorpha subsp. ruderalis]|eukprot:PTQ26606.1 hypothetical protein MARPO_0869s0001 [Marchantia polymorpha]